MKSCVFSHIKGEKVNKNKAKTSYQLQLLRDTNRDNGLSPTGKLPHVTIPKEKHKSSKGTRLRLVAYDTIEQKSAFSSGKRHILDGETPTLPEDLT